MSGLDTAAMIELSAERGGDPARPGKKDPLDPAVWLAARPGEPSWPSEFGPGRPGWHVECAAIATEYLGESFDVQAGGTDLIFPHHEMSASHARVALAGTGAPVFARRYAHAGMVRLDGEKMSKSRGNLVFVSRLLAAGTDPMAIRLAILAHHYRDDWDWTDAGLAAAAGRWLPGGKRSPPQAPITGTRARVLRPAWVRPRAQTLRPFSWWPACASDSPMTSTLVARSRRSTAGSPIRTAGVPVRPGWSGTRSTPCWALRSEAWAPA